jgi:GLPGLI family protein
MGQKIAISTEAVEDEDEVKPTIEYLEETKEIAGYNCKKAVYKIMKDGTEAVFEVFYTGELPAEANTQFKGIDGFPMEYIIEAQGMVITYSAIDVSEEKIDKSLGEIPSGYEQMTYDEFMQMMGGQ